MQKFLLSAILFFLILITFSIFFFFYETRFFGSRASMNQVDISADNSYVFVAPLVAKADGQQKERITVFVLNSQGVGVYGKKVVLTNNAGVIATEVQPTTDQTGKAVFDYASSLAGDYYLEVRVDSITLPQKAHLSFN